jgi:predicted DCC family thiol-disulfide oxidoreductase YuxK
MDTRSTPPRSYRDDPAVPRFDDSRPVFVFDGTCAMCSRGVRVLMRIDRRGMIACAAAQGELGKALYRHYAIALDDTYLLIADGRLYTKSAGYFRMLREIGGWWRLAGVLRLIPQSLLDWAYDRVAANRYRWFGQAAVCALLTDAQRARLLDSPAGPDGRDGEGTAFVSDITRRSPIHD